MTRTLATKAGRCLAAARGAPTDDQAKRDYYDQTYHCTAVVGINTSALIEASIVRRPVFTMLAGRFRNTQQGIAPAISQEMMACSTSPARGRASAAARRGTCRPELHAERIELLPRELLFARRLARASGESRPRSSRLPRCSRSPHGEEARPCAARRRLRPWVSWPAGARAGGDGDARGSGSAQARRPSLRVTRERIAQRSDSVKAVFFMAHAGHVRNFEWTVRLRAERSTTSSSRSMRRRRRDARPLTFAVDPRRSPRL